MTVTAVLFAGGLSSRMGIDKAWLEISGQPLWARQIDLLRRLQPQALWISARAEPSWRPADIDVVPDSPPSCGPLSGLVAVLEKLETSHLLALAIDLPQMTVEPLARCLSLAEAGGGVIPENEGGFEPLCAVYPQEAKTFARAALNAGQLSLQKLVPTLLSKNLIQTWPVAPADRAFFLNVNTPADLKR